MAALGGLVGVRLLSELLSPREYGRFALGLTLANLGQQAFFGPLANGFLRLYPMARERDELEAFFAAAHRLLRVVGTAIAGLFGVLALVSVIGGSADHVGLLVAVLALSLALGLDASASSIQTAARNRAIVALHAGAAMWLRNLVAAGFLLVLMQSASMAMAGSAAGLSLVVLSQRRFLQRRLPQFGGALRGRHEATDRYAAQIRAYAWPFAIFGLVTWAYLASDRWALQAFTSTADVGRYMVLFQLGYYPIALFVAAVVQLVAPLLFAVGGDASDSRRLERAHSRTRALVVLAVGLTVLASAAAMVLHRDVFDVLAAPEYRSVSRFLPGVVLAAGLYSCAQLAALHQMIGLSTNKLVVPTVVTTLLGITLTFVLAEAIGISGVVIAAVIFSATYLIWVVALPPREPDALSPGEPLRNPSRLQPE